MTGARIEASSRQAAAAGTLNQTRAVDLIEASVYALDGWLKSQHNPINDPRNDYERILSHDAKSALEDVKNKPATVTNDALVTTLSIVELRAELVWLDPHVYGAWGKRAATPAERARRRAVEVELLSRL